MWKIRNTQDQDPGGTARLPECAEAAATALEPRALCDSVCSRDCKPRQGGGEVCAPPTESAVFEILCIFSVIWERKTLKL